MVKSAGERKRNITWRPGSIENENIVFDPTISLEVLGAGLWRTGTFSLQVALDILGFQPSFHGAVKPYELFPSLRDRMSGKTIDWQEALRGYRSICDFGFFWEEIYEVFPSIRLIYTKRDPEEWFDSMMSTALNAIRVYGSSKEKDIWQELVEYTFGGDFSKDTMIEAFKTHEDKLTQRSKTDKNILIFDIKDGWEPLCDFLRVPIPHISFPVGNTTADFRSNFFPERT